MESSVTTGLDFWKPYKRASNSWRWNEIGHIQGLRLQETFLNQVSSMANVVLQYPIPGLRVVPYIGGGVGGTATFFDTDGLSNGVVTAVGSDHDSVLAYQGFAGLRLTLNRQISMGVGYTYFASDDASYHFEPLVCCGPELRVGFDRGAIHMVRLNLTLKFSASWPRLQPSDFKVAHFV